MTVSCHFSKDSRGGKRLPVDGSWFAVVEVVSQYCIMQQVGRISQISINGKKQKRINGMQRKNA